MQTTIPYRPTIVAPRPSLKELAAILFFLVAITATVMVLGWQFWHANRIFSGVTVANVPVGGLTRAAAVSKLRRELNPYPLPSVTLTDGRQRWMLPTDQLDVRLDLTGVVNEAYLLGRGESFPVNLRTQWHLLRSGEGLMPELAINGGQVSILVSQIASELRRAGRPPVQIQDLLLPGEPGLEVDVEATSREVMELLRAQRPGQVPLQIIELPIPPAPIAGTTDGAGRITIAEPLIVGQRGADLQFALDPVELQRFVRAWQPLQIDERALTELVGRWADAVALPARDARLRFEPLTRELNVTQPSQAGRRLDVPGTVAAIRRALEEGRSTAELVVESVAPAVDMNRLSELGIRELVVAGTTYFAGSSAARIRNIEVAAAKFDGVVLPPEGIFSFNEIVEQVTAANGFEDSLIIWGDRTAVGVGGGVCQVSTTLFRAAFEAGLPIVERYNHGYVVSWYGEPGLDATIYTPTVDFRFRNDTGAHLLIHPEVDGSTGVITFYFYGTAPQRKVEILEPVISEVTPPGPDVYQEEASLKAGEIRQVEKAKDGMTVTVERVITEADGAQRRGKLVSVYQPWPAVYLIGPGTPVPEGATVQRLPGG